MFFSTPWEPPRVEDQKVDFGLAVQLRVSLKRLPRQRCAWCNLRRVCFVLSVEDVVQGLPMCAVHAGVR